MPSCLWIFRYRNTKGVCGQRWEVEIINPSIPRHDARLPQSLLATRSNSQVGCGSGSTRTRTVAASPATWTPWPIGHGPVLPPTTQHFKFTMLAPIKCVSSDHIMIWSVCTLCRFGRSFTSRFQICNWTDIRWVANEHLQLSPKTCCFFTVIQWILVWL